MPSETFDANSAPAEPAYRYSAALAERIELRWQDEWEARGTFWAANPEGGLTDENGKNADPAAKKFFVMDMFPYPSGKGLHVGHPLGYIATDVVGRYRRMRGDNVLHALGYDAFGLPAEQFAVQTGTHPRLTTEQNIANMRRQLRRLGLAHDPRRSFATTEERYVRWTQWIFLQIFNSWYDDETTRRDGGIGSAMPISTLIEKYEKGEKTSPDGRAWGDLTPAEQHKLVNEHRLVYISQAPVNWCPGLGTVLANEEVTAEGRSDVGNYPVFQRNLRQWMMRITAYAERLADDLDEIDWPDKVKAMQRNWIGRSEGAEVDFLAHAPAGDSTVTVFTTRPDTLFGATFMVVSPEHPLTDAIPAAWPQGTREAWKGGYATPQEAVTAYKKAAARKTQIERQAEDREKTGVFTGIFASNPVTGAQVPVFTADYVLMGYGTGAIMAVPAHDERDWDFAKAFDLDIVQTISADDGWDGQSVWTGDGVITNSNNAEVSLDGLDKAEGKKAIIAYLEGKGAGHAVVSYRLRDWLFSRQRYWGEPFPIVYDDDDQPLAVPDSALPIQLPEVPDFSPRTYDADDAGSMPEAPLSRNEDWVNVTLDLGEGPKCYRRDTNVMPQWAGSCSYYLRYLDPDESNAVVAPGEEKYWLAPRGDGDKAGGVDLYVGGVEHAVLHLLYSRFWHKVLYDLGVVSGNEPFHRLFNQGYIQAYAYQDARGQYVPATEVEGDEKAGFSWQGEKVARIYGKMGKSLKNIVTPDDMYEEYGADTLRVYEMSMGPLDISRPWDTRTVVGSQRFLQRLWRNIVDENSGALLVDETPCDDETRKLLNRTIADVSTEMEGMRFNTAIAKMIVLNNQLTGMERVPREVAEALVLMVAPIAPHIAEELWNRMGHAESLAHTQFPQADPAWLVQESVVCVVQIQGKIKARLDVDPSISESELEKLALAEPNVVKAIDGKPVRKVIVKAPKLVNLVVG